MTGERWRSCFSEQLSGSFCMHINYMEFCQHRPQLWLRSSLSTFAWHQAVQTWICWLHNCRQNTSRIAIVLDCTLLVRCFRRNICCTCTFSLLRLYWLWAYTERERYAKVSLRNSTNESYICTFLQFCSAEFRLNVCRCSGCWVLQATEGRIHLLSHNRIFLLSDRSSRSGTFLSQDRELYMHIHYWRLHFLQYHYQMKSCSHISLSSCLPRTCLHKHHWRAWRL